MLEKLYKPVNRILYPLNFVTYGFVLNGLDRGNQSATDLFTFTVLPTILATLSLASAVYNDKRRKHQKEPVFWETLKPYDFRRG